MGLTPVSWPPRWAPAAGTRDTRAHRSSPPLHSQITPASDSDLQTLAGRGRPARGQGCAPVRHSAPDAWPDLWAPAAGCMGIRAQSMYEWSLGEHHST